MSWLGQNIVLGWGPTLVRLAAGGFFLPHVYAKLSGPGTIVFFQAAGFKPPARWMYLACAIETAVACSLLSNVLVRYFGILGAVHLLVAAAAVYIVSRGKWLWNIGGFEYCVFWAICCLAVAING
jgi:putative oxidoreductase